LNNNNSIAQNTFAHTMNVGQVGKVIAEALGLIGLFCADSRLKARDYSYLGRTVKQSQIKFKIQNSKFKIQNSKSR